jgi:hypothetical protein
MSPLILNQQPWPESELTLITPITDGDEFAADMAYLRSPADAIFEYVPPIMLRDIAERDGA